MSGLLFTLAMGIAVAAFALGWHERARRGFAVRAREMSGAAGAKRLLAFCDMIRQVAVKNRFDVVMCVGDRQNGFATTHDSMCAVSGCPGCVEARRKLYGILLAEAPPHTESPEVVARVPVDSGGNLT